MTRVSGTSEGSPVPVVRVGVIASRELVSRIVRTADAWVGDSLLVSLIPLVYETEEDSASLIDEHRDEIDVALFAGPLSYDIARAEGPIPVPGAHLSLVGSALHTALLRLGTRGVQDLSRLSIDSLSADDVTAAFGEAGLDSRRVLARPYTDPSDAASFLDFHRSVADRCAAALTSLPSVAQRLEADGHTVELMRPTDASIRAGVREAALRGAGRALGETKPAVIVVIVGRDPGAEDPTSLEALSRARALFAVRAALGRLCSDAGMALSVLGERGFTLHATRGQLAGDTLDDAAQQIITRVEKEVGISPSVGVGVGSTPLEAERAAFRSLSGTPGGSLETAPPAAVTTDVDGVYGRFSPLFDTIAARGPGRDTVDASVVASVLGVSERTAARILNELVEQGLAWLLPAEGTRGRGRPRRMFRLVLPRDESTSSAALGA